jgi:ABC-type multidrug transport system ATPase subunit
MIKLEIDSITKSYNRKVILSDIYMSCKKGEIVALIGRNGSGKSTLLKIVFGSEKAESKFVRVGNKIVKNVAEAKNLIGYLPQDNFLPNNISVKSLIKLFLKKENRQIVLKNDYIKPLLNKKNQDLSGGEKRIVEILLITNSPAEFVLLDEPFNGLSPMARNYIIDYINTMKSTKGFIITDHDYENVINIANTILYLKDGFLKEIKATSELVELGYMSESVYDEFNR